MNDVFAWPVGRDETPGGRDPATRASLGPVLAYAASTTLAGAAVGLLIGFVGEAFRLGGAAGRDVLMVTLVVASVIAILAELGGSATLLPQRRRQVPRRWLLWQQRSATAASFGLMIGAGVLTPIRFASAYVLAAVVLLAPSPPLAALVGAIYGASRGSALLVTWVAGAFAHRKLPWDRLAASQHLRVVVAFVAAACFGAVLAIGPT